MARAKKLEMEDPDGQRRLLPGPKMIEAESSVVEKVMMALSAAGCIVWRNTVGTAKMAGGYVTVGMGKGSPDVGAIVPPHGRYLGVECKRPKGGRVSPDQVRWAHEVRAKGGIVGTATNVAQALALLAEAKS